MSAATDDSGIQTERARNRQAIEELVGVLLQILPLKANIYPDQDVKTWSAVQLRTFFEDMIGTQCPAWGDIAKPMGLQIYLADMFNTVTKKSNFTPEIISDCLIEFPGGGFSVVPNKVRKLGVDPAKWVLPVMKPRPKRKPRVDNAVADMLLEMHKTKKPKVPKRKKSPTIEVGSMLACCIVMYHG